MVVLNGQCNSQDEGWRLKAFLGPVRHHLTVTYLYSRVCSVQERQLVAYSVLEVDPARQMGLIVIVSAVNFNLHKVILG